MHNESGWYRRPWPYLMYGALFGLIVGGSRIGSVQYPGGDIGPFGMLDDILVIVPSVVACALVGLLAWLAVLARHKLRGAKSGPDGQSMPEKRPEPRIPRL